MTMPAFNVELETGRVLNLLIPSMLDGIKTGRDIGRARIKIITRIFWFVERQDLGD